jgi:hypothetical protein
VDDGAWFAHTPSASLFEAFYSFWRAVLAYCSALYERNIVRLNMGNSRRAFGLRTQVDVLRSRLGSPIVGRTGILEAVQSETRFGLIPVMRHGDVEMKERRGWL